MKHLGLIGVIVLALFSFQLLVGQYASTTSGATSRVVPTPDQICGGVSHNLQLCSSPVDAVFGETVPLVLILKNSGDQPLSLSRDGFFEDYEITINDPTEQPIKSRHAVFAERVQKGLVSLEEQVNALPFNENHKAFEIPGRGEISIVYSLDTLYEFPKPGAYKVDIARRLPSGDMAWLPTITLILKPKPKK